MPGLISIGDYIFPAIKSEKMENLFELKDLGNIYVI